MKRLIKKVRSWSKPDIPNLIGRKKVDLSIFESGTTIPLEFYEDFTGANENRTLKIGEKVEIQLIVEDKFYLANLVYLKRNDNTAGALQIRYDTNNELKEYLKDAFSSSYLYITEKREEKSKKSIQTPEEKAEYLEFYQTDKPFEYEIKIVNNKPAPEKSLIKDGPQNYITYRDLVTQIHNFIKNKGFLYTKEEVINLFLSLKTKPFVILSGISGTGKTKMVQWFAESVGANEDNGQFTLIPVRPDWNDSSDLLGYIDIKGEFKEGPLTKVVKRAEENPELPYFLLLDEMNLARVEHYFSDILSIMESRKWVEGKVLSSNLLTKEIAGEDLKLPNNLYIIGTVNMDETTHPFSKKVLDRANTIEFNRVDLGNLEFLQEREEAEPIDVHNEKFASKYLHLKDVFQNYKEIVERATNELVKINEILKIMNAHVGYRVRDEICFYLAYNDEGNLLTFEQALDHCILQKILPRITGSDVRVEKLLKELYTLFTNKEFIDNQDTYDRDIQTSKYPRSAEKVLEMLRRFNEDGFTSFWIS